MIHRRSLGPGLFGMMALGAFARPAHAAYPDRVITIVVPFAAGGATDLAGRLMAEKLGPLLGDGGRAVVDNRPGAGSALGADTVRRAKPDGYTLLVGSASTLAVAPASGAAAARYHPTQDFTPLAMFGISTMGLLVSRDSGIATVPELLGRLRANPGKFSFASSGVGGIAHLASEYFCKSAGVEAVHIPYRGGSQTAEAIMKGETLFAIDTVGSNIGQIRDGSLRLLAVSTKEPGPQLPGGADHRRGRRAGLRDRQLDGPRRAGRDAARDRQGHRPRGRQGDRRSRGPQPARGHRHPAGAEQHAGGDQGLPRPAVRPLPRGRPAHRPAARIAGLRGACQPARPA